MEFVDLEFKSRTQGSVILNQLSIAYFVMRWYCGDFPHFTAIFPASRQVLFKILQKLTKTRNYKKKIIDLFRYR